MLKNGKHPRLWAFKYRFQISDFCKPTEISAGLNGSICDDKPSTFFFLERVQFCGKNTKMQKPRSDKGTFESSRLKLSKLVTLKQAQTKNSLVFFKELKKDIF